MKKKTKKKTPAQIVKETLAYTEDCINYIDARRGCAAEEFHKGEISLSEFNDTMDACEREEETVFDIRRRLYGNGGE